jgi:hypothetical protein
MMHGKYPALQLEWIKVLDRHRRVFTHRHPMEKNYLTGVRIDDKGRLWLDGVEIMEMYTLNNEHIASLPIQINVTRIKEGLASGAINFEMVRARHSQEWHDYILKTCGCDEEHIARITPKDLKRPAIMISWDPKMSMTSTIDGSHRICRHWREGHKFFEMAIVKAPDVRQFISFDMTVS